MDVFGVWALTYGTVMGLEARKVLLIGEVRPETDTERVLGGVDDTLPWDILSVCVLSPTEHS